MQYDKTKLLQEVQENVSRETFYTPDQIGDVMEQAQLERFLIKSKGIEIYNCACSFDIETYSFYENGEKRCIMYIWQMCINGLCVVGRTWEEFENVIMYIVNVLGLYEKKRLLIFVHNLSYEFQFICKRFTWLKVFAIDERKPVYAVADNGIEFRCSYILTNYSLATVAKNLQYKIEKLDSLDYLIARNSKTVLTDQEILYCLNDVKIVVLYIVELLQTERNLGTIPLTKTGFVRRFVRDSCFLEPFDKHNPYKRRKYLEIMSALTMTVQEYQQLKRAFQGGFAHASAWFATKTAHDVLSYDETSAYPYVMVAMQFPMSAPEHIEIKSAEEFKKNLKLYCCCFDICFEDLEATTTFENYISVSRCWHKEKVVENNGRVVSATKIWTTITEQDFFIINKMYTWGKMHVANFMRFKRDYLPRDFVKAVLTLYADKTTLKDVKGMEREYMSKKEMLNSCYGMSVTDPVRDVIEFTEKWKTTLPDLVKALEKYNTNKNRFLYYPWGVWVTAYARKRVIDGILAIGENNYLYSDTDSDKFIKSDAAMQYFENENKKTVDLLNAACSYHHLNNKYIRPKTQKGVEKILGVWENETEKGAYKSFKALRAKCYLVEDHTGEIHLTVSGLNKKATVPYLKEKYGSNENIFKAFDDGLFVPAEATGKNTHTYIDKEISGTLTDYQGNTASYHELSFVHLEAASYDLSMEEYKNYLLTIRENQAL